MNRSNVAMLIDRNCITGENNKGNLCVKNNKVKINNIRKKNLHKNPIERFNNYSEIIIFEFHLFRLLN